MNHFGYLLVGLLSGACQITHSGLHLCSSSRMEDHVIDSADALGHVQRHNSIEAVERASGLDNSHTSLGTLHGAPRGAVIEPLM